MSTVPAVTPAISPDEWRDKVMRKCQESVEIKNKFFERYAQQIGQLSQEMVRDQRLCVKVIKQERRDEDKRDKTEPCGQQAHDM